MENKKEPCRRCLLAEIKKDDVLKSIEMAVGKLKDSEKVDEENYNLRLQICKECEFLEDGTCLKCGCYVELRAWLKKGHCPLAGSKKKW